LQQAQVEAVIAAQKSGDARTFGEIAISLGYATREAVGAFEASKTS